MRGGADDATRNPKRETEMPSRFTVLSDPLEEIVASKAREGASSVLFGWKLLRRKGNETVNYIYSDTFGHRLAYVAEQTVTPGSTMFCLVCLTSLMFFLHVSFVQRKANRLVKNYSHME